jgi:Xaa-Pro aminopeptidase
MVISDEPGVYLEGRHGVRIENLVAVQKAETTEFGNFFKFEFLTMCPYERDLIDKSMLTDEEIALVDSYHKEVLDKLSSKVAPEALAYLKEATKPL